MLENPMVITTHILIVLEVWKVLGNSDFFFADKMLAKLI